MRNIVKVTSYVSWQPLINDNSFWIPTPHQKQIDSCYSRQSCIGPIQQQTLLQVIGSWTWLGLVCVKSSGAPDREWEQSHTQGVCSILFTMCLMLIPLMLRACHSQTHSQTYIWRLLIKCGNENFTVDKLKRF